MTIDRIIYRSELPSLVSRNTETIRQWIKRGVLPPYDLNLSRKTCGWKLSTLRASGIDIAV